MPEPAGAVNGQTPSDSPLQKHVLSEAEGGGRGESPLVSVRVELFGTPRLRSGRREVEISLPPQASREQVTHALAEACPALVGHALREDLSDLQDGYVFNRNGTSFLREWSFTFQEGDALLLLSSQAGG